MADFEFRITEGPYIGEYAINVGDVTANDVGDLLSQGGPDLDDVFTGRIGGGSRAIAALVWVARRRGNKGLAYRAVAEHITFAVIDQASSTAAEDPVVPDPSPSAGS